MQQRRLFTGSIAGISVALLTTGCTFDDMRAVPDPLQVPVASVVFPLQMLGYALANPGTRRDQDRDKVAGYVTQHLEAIRAELFREEHPHLTRAMELAWLDLDEQKRLAARIRSDTDYYFDPQRFIEGRPTPLIGGIMSFYLEREK